MDIYYPLKRQAKFVAGGIQNFFFLFFRENVLTFHVNRLLGRWFIWYVMTCFLWKIKKRKKKIVVCWSCDWRFKGYYHKILDLHLAQGYIINRSKDYKYLID